MKPMLLVNALLALGLVVAAPTMVAAHVGHGDEFQAEGGINRVQVNPETDSLLGIEVQPIGAAADGSAAVLIPVTALVDNNGQQLVFVQYENFYEPVPVTTGATQGDLVEIKEGLSAGEKLVTQGSLSLYAESRKTQGSGDAPAAAAPATESPVETARAQTNAQGSPQNGAAASDSTQAGGVAPQATTPQATEEFPVGMVAAMGGGGVIALGAIAVAGINRKKKDIVSDKDGGL